MLVQRNARVSLFALCAACLVLLPQSARAVSSSVPDPSSAAPEPPGAAKNAQGEAQQTGLPPALRSTGGSGREDAERSYRALVEREASRNGLPPDVADAVVAIESGYDPGAIGAVGEIGLMQVRPATAAMLGFKGDLAELARPEVNIRYGVTYLSQAWRLAGGDLCRALMKYRAGHGEETMSPLSVAYCLKARARLAAAGSPFAAGVSPPVAFAPLLPHVPAARRGSPKNRTAAVSRAFWAAEEARVKAITERIHSKWRQMASR